MSGPVTTKRMRTSKRCIVFRSDTSTDSKEPPKSYSFAYDTDTDRIAMVDYFLAHRRIEVLQDLCVGDVVMFKTDYGYPNPTNDSPTTYSFKQCVYVQNHESATVFSIETTDEKLAFAKWMETSDILTVYVRMPTPSISHCVAQTENPDLYFFFSQCEQNCQGNLSSQGKEESPPPNNSSLQHRLQFLSTGKERYKRRLKRDRRKRVFFVDGAAPCPLPFRVWTA